MSKDYNKLALKAHLKTGGKLELTSKFKLNDKDDLSIAYTPGVAAVCMQIFNVYQSVTGSTFPP